MHHRTLLFAIARIAVGCRKCVPPLHLDLAD
jgi:hypothetical protein